MNNLTKDQFGKLFADKGNVSQKLFEALQNSGYLYLCSRKVSSGTVTILELEWHNTYNYYYTSVKDVIASTIDALNLKIVSWLVLPFNDKKFFTHERAKAK